MSAGVPAAEVARWLDGLARTPDVFLHELDFVQRRALLVGLDEARYREASFLDQRALDAGTRGVWLPLETVRAALVALPARPLHAIFHVGHCGSTLLSRLLGSLPGAHALREPLAWLALAMHRRELGTSAARLDAAAWDGWFDGTMRALARTYRPGDVAVLKSTSAGANLAPVLLERLPETRAVLLHTPLETHLAAMLRTAETRESARHYAAAWLGDLRALVRCDDLAPHALSDAETCALAWVAPMLWFAHASRRHPQRTLRVVFEDLLADPRRWLGDVARHVGLTPAADDLDRVTRGPLMRRAAKDPQHAYGPGERTRELAEARRRFADEIDAGLRWAGRFMEVGPGVARPGDRDDP
jgi:hypothetical protein